MLGLPIAPAGAGCVWTAQPAGEGCYRYRQPGGREFPNIVEVSGESATFTDLDGNGETRFRLADLPGRWSGPLPEP